VNGTDDYVAFRTGSGDLSARKPRRWRSAPQDQCRPSAQAVPLCHRPFQAAISTRRDLAAKRRTVDAAICCPPPGDDGIVVVKEEPHV
jgi:hypothetical protein